MMTERFIDLRIIYDIPRAKFKLSWACYNLGAEINLISWSISDGNCYEQLSYKITNRHGIILAATNQHGGRYRSFRTLVAGLGFKDTLFSGVYERIQNCGTDRAPFRRS